MRGPCGPRASNLWGEEMDNQTNSVALLSAATATGYGEAMNARDTRRTFQALGTTTAGAGAAVIEIYVSNVPSPVTATDVEWKLLGSISLTLGTTKTNDGFASDAGWRWVRAKVASISGTNASVDCYMGA